MSMLEEQLPDAIELMVRSLRVGHPFVLGHRTPCRADAGDPLASELGVIADEAAYGRDVSEAIKAMAERLDMQDLRFLAVAVTFSRPRAATSPRSSQGLSK
jgi:tight adherence protein B